MPIPNQTPSVLDVFLPDGTSQYFDVSKWSKDDDNIYITLEEKNIPPSDPKYADKKMISKGFTNITITDFPIRGHRALLTFRRRYWQVEGQKELLKRDIPLCFPGTQLETAFANFLKEDGGVAATLPGYYRRMSTPPDQRI